MLSDVDPEEIQAVVSEAIAWLEKNESGISNELRAALLDRLTFRREFLSALEVAVDCPERKSIRHLEASLRQVELINKSSKLGKSVEDAFSLKIQRRLASTVPPRPMVRIKSEDAIEHMNRFCQDFIDAHTILDYTGTHNLRVNTPILYLYECC